MRKRCENCAWFTPRIPLGILSCEPGRYGACWKVFFSTKCGVLDLDEISPVHTNRPGCIDWRPGDKLNRLMEEFGRSEE